MVQRLRAFFCQASRFSAEKGQRLHQVHRQFHQQLDELVQQTLAGASEENRRFLQQFLDAVEHKILGMYF